MSSTNYQQNSVELTIDHVLNRIGAKNQNYPRFKYEPTEQQNKDLIDVFMKDLSDFFTDYLIQERAILRDPLLSGAGQQEKLVPVQRKFNERLNNDMCKRIRTLQEIHLNKVVKVYELPPEVVSGDAVILELRAREVRDHIRALSPADRVRLLFKDGDPFLIYAFETAPTCIELVPAQVLEYARTNRVMRKRGADLIPLQDERLALQRIVGVFENIPMSFKWATIVPGFLAMGDSVFPPKKEQDPVIGEGEDAELMRLAAKMAAGVTAAA